MSLSRQPAHFRLDLLLLAVLSKQPGCGTWGWDGSRGLEDFFCAASDAEHLSERSELCEETDNRRAQKKSPNAAPSAAPSHLPHGVPFNQPPPHHSKKARQTTMLYVKNLKKSYLVGKKSYPVLKDITLSVAEKEFVAVMGPSGSGKSTLLNCISCYIPFEEGKITLGGQELKGMNEVQLAKVRNEKLGFVFQDFMLLDGLTIRENILVPRIIQGSVDKEAEKHADHLISLFGIDHIADKYPAEVSGGERQRTAVARSLINHPLLILADEPTGNLDSKSSRTVIESFENAKKQMGATIFMVTHDSFSASFCDKVILLKDGCVYRQLNNPGNQREFHDILLNAIREMSREDD